MDSLKSTALIPGEPEYKTEFNLLNMLLLKIPKHVDLRLILNAKPLQPRHSVALHELHSELFPIRYDPKFFEVACSTECGFFDAQSFWDCFDSSPNDTRDLDWYENQIMSIGIFLPRTYVSFFRRTGEYEIDKYLQFLVKDSGYNEFDDPLTELLLYDHECDEFMIGFVTMLINMEETNNLISGDDYNILRTFYKNKLRPLIYNTKSIVDGTNDSSGIDSHETENRIKSCMRINESLLEDSFYVFLYNHLYNNELLMEYVKKFTIKKAKSIYILSTGITLGLRKRGLGTHIILFVQLLIYYINYNIYIYEDNYYKLTNSVASKVNNDTYNHKEDCDKVNLATIRNYYNSKFISKTDMRIYYTYVLNLTNMVNNQVNLITQVNESKMNKIDLNSKFNKFNKNNISNNINSSFNRNANDTSSLVNNNGTDNTKNDNLVTVINSTLANNLITDANSLNNNLITGNNVTVNANLITDNDNTVDTSSFSSDEDSDVSNSGANDLYNKMPLVIYLHTIHYNEYATKMYEHSNFYRIQSIPDYYNINNKRYDANFLAHYLCL